MGYPNPEESPYDLFMTGHAGASVSTVLGLKAGDDLLRDVRATIAVPWPCWVTERCPRESSSRR